MQVGIARGEKIPLIADAMSHLADDDGITGFMHGAAKALLKQTWKYGDQLA